MGISQRGLGCGTALGVDTVSCQDVAEGRRENVLKAPRVPEGILEILAVQARL
jgi:hypothetical protein